MSKMSGRVSKNLSNLMVMIGVKTVGDFHGGFTVAHAQIVAEFNGTESEGEG